MEYMYPSHTEYYDYNGNVYDDRQIPFFPFFPGSNPPPNQGGGSFFLQGGPPMQPPGNQANQPPLGPPPQHIPEMQSFGGPQVKAVDPGSIRGCLYRYTYIRLNRWQGFWFYPTFVGRQSVAGYRWTGFNWVYFGIDLNRIQSFQCV
ncbi:hypothetical protein ACFOZ1_03070 [Gracilibacillus marinus]|jgi:hypothetical protein|uniref:Transporter n=1 Tax=Gracilibacillus marinus TaxID=630535 RepID=A0ABV8VUR8_9BACI